VVHTTGVPGRFAPVPLPRPQYPGTVLTGWLFLACLFRVRASLPPDLASPGLTGRSARGHNTPPMEAAAKGPGGGCVEVCR